DDRRLLPRAAVALSCSRSAAGVVLLRPVWLENEELCGDVWIEVHLREKRTHLPTRRTLDRVDESRSHCLLEREPRLPDRLDLARVDEGSLHRSKDVLEERDHVVAIDHRAHAGRPAPVV